MHHPVRRVHPSFAAELYHALCGQRGPEVESRQDVRRVPAPFRTAAIQASQQLAVQIYLCPVVWFIYQQNGSFLDINRKCRAVEDGTPSLIELFHRLDGFRSMGLGQIVKQGSYFVQLHGRDFNDRHRCRYIRNHLS